MAPRELLLDTVFIQALLNKRDHLHSQARQLLPLVRKAAAVWVTEAVLVEVANALSSFNRRGAAQFVRQCYATSNIQVASVDSVLLNRSLDLYAGRLDKAWSLTDCISFTVMRDQELTHAATSDRHFVQAGFVPLMNE